MEERPFYCEKIERNCPFESQFRYCWDCDDLRVDTEETDTPEVTCEYGFYPYCPNCEHGLVIQEEWMQEDQCKWVCLLDPQEE